MELRPFRSIRFSPRVIRERGLSNVFAPPYDQISPERQDQLYARAPENIVRVTYPKKEGPDPYAGAAKTLADWLAARDPREGEAPRALDLPADLHGRRKDDRARRARGPREARGIRTRDDPAARAHAREAQGGPPRAALGHEGGPRAPVSPDARAPDGGPFDAAGAEPHGHRRRRRPARRVPHLGLRRARRAPGPRQERGIDHRRRPPPLRDGARVLEGPGRREDAGREVQAVRDRRHGVARA